MKIKLLTLFVLAVALVSSLHFFDSSCKFEPTQWKTNIDLRENMVRDLIDSKILIGKSRKEVISILGSDLEMDGINSRNNIVTDATLETFKPLSEKFNIEINNRNNSIVYYPIGRQYFATYLYVEFKNNQVVDAGVIAD